jgi:hypothetical protein
MGAGQSSEEWVQNNIEFSQTTKMLQKVTTSTSCSVVTKQNVQINFEVDNLQIDGTIDIQQLANVDVKTISVSNSGLTATQVTDLQNAVANDCKTMQSKANEDFGAVLGALQAGSSASSQVSNAISNSVNTEITSETVSSLFAQTTVDQASVMTFRGKSLVLKGGINIGQNIVVTVVAQQMVQNTIDAVLQTKAVSDLTNTLSQTQTASNTGLGSIISKAGAAISGILKSSQFIFLVIGIVVVVGAYLYLKTDGGRTIATGAVRRPPTSFARGAPLSRYPPQGPPPQNMLSQGYAPQGMPPQGMPQGMQPQEMPQTEGYGAAY